MILKIILEFVNIRKHSVAFGAVLLGGFGLCSWAQATAEVPAAGSREARAMVQALVSPAMAGDATAQFQLATAFDGGFGVRADAQQALFWYRQAAMGGHLDAQFSLAVMLEEGLGTDADVEAARRWYERAARVGSADAANNLALLYAHRRLAVCAQGACERLAADWFERGAKAGSLDAAFNFAMVLEHGLGRAIDPSAALFWYRQVLKRAPPELVERLDVAAAIARVQAQVQAQMEGR